MSKDVQNLMEVSRPTDFKVDREACVIRDVRILGPKSRNGREYTPQAIAGARELYEGCVVKYDHPDPRNPKASRPMNDTAGWMENVRVASDGGLIANLPFLKADPRADKLCEAAERRPELFGLSHNVDGKIRRHKGTALVEEITRVHSVDVVSDPATTRSLFESIEQEEADMSVTITEYLEKQEADNPTVKLLQEMVEVGIVKPDFAVDDEVAGKLKKLWEGKWLEKPPEKPPEKKDDDPPVDDKLAKILESQDSLQKQLTEMKGQMNVQKPKGGMPITEDKNGNEGEKSKDARDFCERITGRIPAA